EVVGGIAQTNERAFQAADATGQLNAVLAFLSHFQRQVYRACLLVQFAFGSLFRLQRFEIIELVKAEQAEFPQARVVNLAFFNGQFAADDLVAGGGIALEFDAANIKGLAFIHVDHQSNKLLVFINLGIGNGGEIDVAKLSISLAQIIQALAHVVGVKDIAIFHGEQAAQRGRIPYRFVVLKGDGAEVIAVSFNDGHSDVHHLALALLDERYVDVGMGIAQLGLGVLHDSLEVALLLVGLAYALGVLIQLAGIVGLGKYVFQENGMGNANGPQVLHGIAQFAALEFAIAFKADVAHLDLGSLFDDKGDGDGGGGDGTHFCAHGSELAAVLGQHFLDDHGSLGHLGGVELALHRKTHLPLLEAVEQVAL